MIHRDVSAPSAVQPFGLQLARRFGYRQSVCAFSKALSAGAGLKIAMIGTIASLRDRIAPSGQAGI